ncbi:MAG: deoxyribodipyrimidine photolyase [Crocinitomicaceae bacterium]|nr:deoxyribodipyrimidine photolyase [Crocinitomicaceae bacterium]|tara:strand:- start:81388 stop:82689 length:1302 start_codon:yes stop_codon:yes gene_type:complete
MSKEKTAIVWFTNNLRVSDNTVLSLALKNHTRVFCVYCFNKSTFEGSFYGFKRISIYRTKFLIESVSTLKKNLETNNIPLFVYYGKPEKKISELFLSLKAEFLYVQKETTKEENELINLVEKSLPRNVHIKKIFDQFLFHPDLLNFDSEKKLKSFSSFRKRAGKIKLKLELGQCIKKPKNNLTHNTTKIPCIETLGFKNYTQNPNSCYTFVGGEDSANKRVENYFFETKEIRNYKKTRNGLIGPDYSSKLSPWLANGSISTRTVYSKILEHERSFGRNESTYWLFFELLWRDFFKHISIIHSKTLFLRGGMQKKHVLWKKDRQLIDSWINGKTSEPFVNSNMVELKKTGWMSNRGRQITSSYFTKNLYLDWRVGAAYFESALVDYDVHSNYGNWQYVAGVGNYFKSRSFDIPWQAKTYDSNKDHQSIWLKNKK